MRELDLLGLEQKRIRWYLIPLPEARLQREGSARLFSEAHSEETRGNVHKL